MKENKYILSIVTAYMCYFTHGIQALVLAQNKVNFFTQWGYADAEAGSAAVSMAIMATGLGKFLTVWIGGEVSDKIGRKKMAVAGGVLYVISFGGLLLTNSFTVACICAFLAGAATSGFWDASLYPAVQEAAPKYTGSVLIGIKFFISLSSIFYPVIVVKFAHMGLWHMNVWIPLALSVVCVLFAAIAPFAYDDQMKTGTNAKKDGAKNADTEEIDSYKAKQLVKPNGLVNFFTLFYAFICMFIMYGAQQYSKAFGMANVGLTEMQSAALTSVYTFGSIIAVVFWAFMMARLKWNLLKVLFIDCVFVTAALAIVLLAGNAAVIFAAIGMLGFFAAGGALQIGLGVRQMFCPGPKGRNTGMYYTFMGFASFFLPYMVSAMTRTIGESRAVYIMLSLLLGASVFSVIMMLYLLKQHKIIFGVSALTE